ncbi:unnamed protein product [Orchesella dallaii]|uniref:Gustatory receptor n=1 Tax=Orchesella dallaii TaxID=48710 RepID=A0ABP1R1T9_9HEXA
MALQIMLPISSIIAGHLNHVRIGSFAKFLNNWSVFLKELDIVVSPYYCINFNMKRILRLYFYLFLIPSLCISIISTSYLMTTQVLEVGNDYMLSKVFIVVWVESMVAMRLITNLKDFMNLTVLSVAYRELRNGIQAQYDELLDQISLSHVRSWYKLVHFIRQQRSVLEHYFGFSNLWFLIEMFVIILLVLTAAIFVFMRGQNEHMTVEDLLAESIIGMNDGENCDARLEMKAICDLIFHDPVKITIANVTVLNKRLILAFCSHLAASLVILLQFVNH